MVAAALLAGGIVGARVSASLAGTVTTTTTVTTTATTVTTTATTVATTPPRVAVNGAACAGHGCVAVGEEDSGSHVALPYAERWADGVWTQRPTPQPSRTTMRTSALNAVSCWSASGCVAVGGFFPSCCQSKAFAERWTGSSWKLQRDIGPGVSPGYQLYGVSCPSARFCLAVGYGSGSGNGLGLVERWSGNRWVREPTPDPDTNPNTDLESGESVDLTAVSCADRGDCVAIGSWVPPQQTRYQPVAEIYAHGRSLVRSPLAPRGFSYALNSISCPTASECVAVGSSGRASAPWGPLKQLQPLVERWNGQRWAAQRLPDPTGLAVSLDSVACASATSCTALGQSEARVSALFGERWNGRTWRRQAIALTDHGANLQPIGLSCATARTCTAVFGLETGSLTGPLIADFVGGRWSVRSQS